MFRDPLVLHDLDQPKTEALRKGIEAVKGSVFRPTWLTVRPLFNGNTQTIISVVKEYVQSKLVGPYPFDKEEIFKLEDGGQILLQYRGNLFKDEHRLSQRPLLFIVPGLTSTGQSGYIRNMTDIAYKDGFDVVVINYRGIGLQLSTPMFYCGGSYKDVYEPMKHIYDSYCKESGRKIFAVGTSLGGVILGNLLGHYADGLFIDAAAILHSPVKYWEMIPALKGSMFGVYDRALFTNPHNFLSENIELMGPAYAEKVGKDLKGVLGTMSKKPSILDFDDQVTGPFFGYAGGEDYYRKTACVHNIPKIKIPTLFMNALDDSVVGPGVVAYEEVKANENCVQGTNRSGGHLGCHESLFSLSEMWAMSPILAFLKTYK